MKISCTQENLNQGLFVTSHIASKSTALPILNNIMIQANTNEIKLSATNLEMGILCVIRGKVEAEGELTIPSRLLADYIATLPKERVDLTISPENKDVGGLTLTVKCKNHSTKIKGQPAVDFPLIPQINKTDGYIIDYANLKQAISQVIFAVSAAETRPEINGVLFNFEKDKLILAATDSYRLAEKTVELNKKSKGKAQKIIVPTKTLQELLRILGSFKDSASLSQLSEISIYVSENQIMFVLDNIELISRLVEGQYPDYQQIIPTQSNTTAIINTSELIGVTKTASLFARSGIYDINLQLDPEKKEVIISSANTQLGENISNINAQITGGVNNIIINYRYLLDGLQNINHDQIQLEIIDPGSPCVLRPAKKDGDYLYIIMPIKQ